MFLLRIKLTSHRSVPLSLDYWIKFKFLVVRTSFSFIWCSFSFVDYILTLKTRFVNRKSDKK